MAFSILHDADFSKELKKGIEGLATGYLLIGEEDYLKKNAIAQAEALLCTDETFKLFNTVTIGSLDFTPERLLDALMPMPMMADKKLVMVTDPPLSDLKSAEMSELTDILANLDQYDHNLLLISLSADAIDLGYLPNRPSALLKKLAEHLTPVLFERCTPSRLAGWASRHFAHNGVTASPEVCALLIRFCGSDMFTLASEIDKVSFYTLSQGRSEVTSEDITAAAVPAIEYDTFDFANAILERKTDRALTILSDMKFRKIDPITILSELISISSDLLQVRLLLDAGLPAPVIAAQLKIHEYKAKIYCRAASALSMHKLEKTVAACADADAALKLSGKGYEPIERLICSL